MSKSGKKFAVVIPARYESSRFPGKPLAKILGLPMIQHVWNRCCQAVDKSLVYVATDDESIKDVVESFGGQVVLTSSSCLTGTDRLAEANETLRCNFIVNVQGDEPLIDPAHINAAIAAYEETGKVTNAMCAINSAAEFFSRAVPKVVTSGSGRLLYMSRSPIPGAKTDDFFFGYRQVCIYVFSSEHLKFFGSAHEKAPLEKVEDIEILRFLEADYQVNMIEVSAGSLAVDFPEDIAIVERELIRRNKA